jgi:3-deoxy-D-manno-octulosonic-acid transferase
LYFAWRIYRDRRYLDHFAERLGCLPFLFEPTPAGAIWLHAVSVGEVISAIPLLRVIRRTYPAAPLFVSCSTIAGRAIAEEKLAGLVTALFYCPVDYAFTVRRVLRKLRPSLVVVMETEIWPNLYREAKRTGATLAVVNGRISDRAFPRYSRWATFLGPVLSHPDILLVQSEEDARRYRALGAPEERIACAGNLKYDFNPGDGEIPAVLRDFLDQFGSSRIVIAASTMPPRDAEDVDEDDIVISAYLQLAAAHRDLLFILVPRRPERFETAASKLERAGVPYVRRTQLPASPPAPGLPCVLLLDSVGELSRLFSVADVVFMGGTFPRRGGHNILEPAYFGKAVIAGPHMENFAAIAKEFTEAGALLRVNQPGELGPAIARLLNDDRARSEIGGRAQRLAEAKRGVTERIAERLLELYFRTLPIRRGSILLAPLAAVWEAGSRRRRSRALATCRKLARPVVSIGGITLGGTGKTPFVAWLADRLRERGLTPAVLTRGYRRRSAEPFIILPAGADASADLTGDEPQLYLRRGAAHLAIGSDRYEAGRLLLDSLDAGVFILDDGFQHWRLSRDLDVVLIDALDPFGGGDVFPRGRLREPLDALARAGAFVISRCEPGVRTDAIEAHIRRYNRTAPIFRSRVVPGRWYNVRTGRISTSSPVHTVAAFCGLANPRAFWRTLDSLGLDIRFRWSFGDHHHYRIAQLRRLARRARHAGAQAVVTTEKDVANLCPNAFALFSPLPVYALEIDIELDDPDGFLDLLTSILSRG